MHFTTIFATVLTAAVGTTLAFPAGNVTSTVPSGNGNGTTSTLSMMAADQTWTMHNFLRVCNSADTTCTFSYSINTHDGAAPTACHYKANGNPASQASYSNVKCVAFTIGSSWASGNPGFTTLSVVKDGLIIYPAYTDTQLDSGEVVKPDQSYTPNKLP